jgi:hypothetical protein
MFYTISKAVEAVECNFVLFSFLFFFYYVLLEFLFENLDSSIGINGKEKRNSST